MRARPAGSIIQAIDANQDGYLEESLKLCAALHEFDVHEPDSDSGPAIVGFTENIFSGLGTLGSFAAVSERVFGTLVQRAMTNPLRSRYHYGMQLHFNWSQHTIAHNTNGGHAPVLQVIPTCSTRLL